MTRTRRKPVDIPIHPDVGCGYHPKCLTCPLALCRYEEGYDLTKVIALTSKVEAEKRRREGFSHES